MDGLVELDKEGVALLILEEADFNAEFTLVVGLAFFAGEDGEVDLLAGVLL